MSPNSRLVDNKLLKALSDEDFALLKPHLEPVDLPVNFVLSVENKPINFVYLLDSGVVSIVASRSDGKETEVGIIGREGVTGVALLLGMTKSPYRHYMQIAGSGHRMKASHYRRCIQESEALRLMLLRFVHVYMIQLSQTTLANGYDAINERLARWILMCADRCRGTTIPLTHKFLAMMLGVRRVSVTLALQSLESQGLIKARRGVIQILARDRLMSVAGSSYGEPEREYEIAFGWAM